MMATTCPTIDGSLLSDVDYCGWCGGTQTTVDPGGLHYCTACENLWGTGKDFEREFPMMVAENGAVHEFTVTARSWIEATRKAQDHADAEWPEWSRLDEQGADGSWAHPTPPPVDPRTSWGRPTAPREPEGVFCCDERQATNGRECESTCEHESHTPEGRMACNDCGRPIRYDGKAEVYRHLVEPERGCFLIAPEFDQQRDDVEVRLLTIDGSYPTEQAHARVRSGALVIAEVLQASGFPKASVHSSQAGWFVDTRIEPGSLYLIVGCVHGPWGMSIMVGEGDSLALNVSSDLLPEQVGGDVVLLRAMVEQFLAEAGKAFGRTLRGVEQ